MNYVICVQVSLQPNCFVNYNVKIINGHIVKRPMSKICMMSMRCNIHIIF